ncbi:MAG: low molecular weight phosphotyrosine protein phosphatase [Pseudobdellovibrionaceae bacterium]|nr:low molecular weight phosphotyrosine protein phosphatase [Bdellovibrionales bacterium]USN46580.1 MAG: low molecular weight phosphotyrosine protein phosphatase [Pseudobdellovibrionaceae bacterium]
MKRVLFVCLGNICRSPAAEGVLKKMLADANINDVMVDSAGTSAYHEGDPADGRMQFFAKKRGYELTSLSRPFRPEADFEQFDYIITMDESNYAHITEMDPKGTYAKKLYKMVDFCRIHEIDEVPDPYAGGEQGFELVMDILEDGCEQLTEKLKKP